MGYMQPGTKGIVGENRHYNEQPQPEPKRRMKGLGDLVHKVFRAVGIEKAVKTATGGRDCGCARRQQLLNQAFPFGKGQSDGVQSDQD